MFEGVLVLVDFEVLFHLVIGQDVLDELLVLLVLFLLFLLLGFLFGGLGLVFHHALVLEVFKLDQFGELFALDFTDENNFLESLEVLKFLCVRQEPQIKPFNNSPTLKLP